MSERSSVNGILRSMPWPTAEAVTGLLTGAISLFVIARLIGADEYGRSAIALGIILIMAVGVNSLVHDALVRLPEMQPEDLETGFTATLGVAFIFLGIAVAASYWIGRLYSDQRLALLVLGFAPLLPLGAVSETLIARYRRGLEFQVVAKSQIIGRFLGGVLGITAAFMHAGAWSLVVQNISIAAFVAASMWRHAGSLPRLRISWLRLRPMLGFCAPIIASQVMTQGINRLLLLGIGRWHGLSVAGYWSAATRIPENLFGNLMLAAYNVGLAHFSLKQSSRDTLLANLHDIQSITAILSIPVLTALAVGSGPLTLLLLGPSWAPVATLMLGPLMVAFLQIRRMFPTTALRALGRSGISLTASFAEAVTLAIAFFVIGRFSATTFTFVYPLGNLAGSILIFALLIRELDASIWGQLFQFLREIAIGLIAFAAGSAVVMTLQDAIPLVQLLAGGSVAFVTAATLLILTDVKMFLRLAGMAGRRTSL